MLLLSFHLGDGSYAMPCRSIVEIVPSVRLDAVPGAAAYVAGQLDYRGQVVPVIDLRRLVANEPCRACLSTRIVVVEQGRRRVGLLAERVVETMTEDVARFVEPPVHVEHLAFVGGVLIGPNGMTRLLDVERLGDALDRLLRGVDEPALLERGDR